MYAQSERKRDLTGGIRFPLFGGIIDFIMLMLQWFVITVEVFLRRDFGERYLSKLNYAFGVVLLGLWAFGAAMLGDFADSAFSGGNAPSNRIEFGSWLAGSGSGAMVLFWLGFVLAGSLHLARMSWREAVGLPLHSLEWGRSWLTPLGKVVQVIGNKLGLLVLGIIGKFNKGKLPDKYKPFPDVDAVTECFVEPVVMFFLSLILGAATGSVLLGVWLNFAAWALLLTSNYRYFMIRNQILDIRDQMIESTSVKGIMQNDRMRPGRMRITGGAKATLKQMADELQEHPEEARQIMRDDSAITRALAAINPELQNLQQSNQSAYRPAITTTTGEALPENGQDAPPATPAATMPEEPNPATTPPEEEQPRE